MVACYIFCYINICIHNVFFVNYLLSSCIIKIVPLTFANYLWDDFMKKHNYKMIRELNEVKILNLLRDDGPISRSDMAKKTNISKVTISEIVKRLSKEGFTKKAGKGSSTSKGGKRPTLIKLNPDKGYVIGIEIKKNLVNLAIANIEADIIAKDYFKYSDQDSMDEVINKTFQCIDQNLTDLSIDLDKLISIGIGVPGFVDYEKGVLSYSHKGWQEKPFATRFSEKYNIPVLIENDANMVAIGEDLLGAGKEESNFICITLEAGIGAGIIMDELLIRGATGMAGEVGYLKLGSTLQNPEKFENLYSDQNNYSDVLSENHLYEVIKSKLEEKDIALEKSFDECCIIDFLQMAEQGNEVVRDILDEYGEIIANLCTELVKSINPNLMVLSGEVIENSPYLFKKVHKYAKEIMQNIPFDANSIVIGKLSHDMACLQGAITLALQVVFNPFVKHKRLKQIHVNG